MRAASPLLRRWLVAACCLTAAAVLFTGQLRAEYWYAGRQLSWLRALSLSLVGWQLWTLLAPVVLQLAARLPVSRSRLALPLAVHIPCSLLIAIIHFVADALVTRALTNGLVPFGPSQLYMNVLTYWAIVAAVQYA